MRTFLGTALLILFSLPAEASPYGIQVGAFREFGRAEEIQEILEDADYPSYLIETDGLLKVRVGTYADRNRAQDQADALWAFLIARFGVEKFQKPWVIPEDRPISNAAARAGRPISAPLFPEVTPGSEARRVIELAASKLGSPYRWAGTGPGVFDCSGFIWFVFGELGHDLPRTAREQFGTGSEVALENLLPGDLVFFQTYAPGPSHVGIYVGEGEFIHASSGSGGVIRTPLSKRYYANRYLGARRVRISS